jgi:hypothetical protein
LSRGPFGTARPLSLAALDAAISETIGKPVRADRLSRDDVVYRWICRRAIAEGSLRFNTTYAEAAAGAGYPVPRLNCRPNRRRARQQRVSTVYRALCSLQAAGLVRFHGVKRANGQWRCLSVGLTPAAFGPRPPFGRSRRAPTRGPDRRIRFSRRSGTSPEVAIAKNRSRVVDIRAHAREGPRTAARESQGDDPPSPGGFLAAALAPTEAPSDPSAPRPWPNELWDLREQEAVELVELFEAAFGIPAQFSYEKRGPWLRRILDRFDRYGDRTGYTADGRRWRHGAGFRAAAELILQRGALYRTGNRRLAKVRSLAYFLPLLDQQSKKERRTWRAHEGREVWGPTKEER